MAARLRPPAGQPIDQGSEAQPNIAWMEWFQAAGDILGDQDARFAALEAGQAGFDTDLTAVNARLAALEARPLMRAGQVAVALDINGDGVITLPVPFPAAFLAGVVGMAAKAYAPGTAVIDHTACTASTLAVAVRPNPGAVSVAMSYVVQGH